MSNDLRLILIGPLPPPAMGQALVMSHMVSKLTPHFTQLRIADIAEGGEAVRWLRPFVKIRRSAAAWSKIPGSDAVYIAVKATHGM